MTAFTLHHTLRRALCAAALAVALTAPAQNLQSGYFDSNYLYRYQSNPAFGNHGHGFISVPGLGNLNLTTSGTVSLDHIFYNVDGRTTTLLNPSLTAAKVLGPLKDQCRLGIDLRETVLAIGFKGMGGYNTITVGARADVNVSVPKDIMRLAKEGPSSNTPYQLKHFGAAGAAWAEVALGHSHDINKHLSVGATLKLLVGAGSFRTDIKDATLELGEDSWNATVDAAVYSHIKGLQWDTDRDDKTGRRWVNGAKIRDYNPIGGIGAAVDLGVVYRPADEWEFSASVLDLGAIAWSDTQVATTGGPKTVRTADYTFDVDNNDEWDKFADNLAELYQLEPQGNAKGQTSGIGATFNIGAQYSLPFVKILKLGVLNTTRINGQYGWTDFRVSATLSPAKIFSVGANVGIGTFGPSVGWIVNLRTPGLSLFVGSDRTPLRLAKQYVPLNSNMNLNMGLNIPF